MTRKSPPLVTCRMEINFGAPTVRKTGVKVATVRALAQTMTVAQIAEHYHWTQKTVREVLVWEEEGWRL